MRERTVTINSISKTYSVTGWRVGWAIAPAAITKRIRKVHDFLTVGAPTPFQHAAAFALRLPLRYYENLQKRYAISRSRLFGILTEAGFDPILPKGAYYIMAEADDVMERLSVANDFDLSRKLIEITKVATVPGSSFYSGHKKRGNNQVRFCFCKSADTLDNVEKQFAILRKGSHRRL